MQFNIIILNEIYIDFFMIFLVINFQKAALHIAIEKENIEIVKILLSNKNIDVNLSTVLIEITNEICIKLFDFIFISIISMEF